MSSADADFDARFSFGMIRRATVEQALSSARAGDHKRVVELLSGSHLGKAWAQAMTAHYGPTYLHKDWIGPDGRPTEECLAAFPHIAYQMRQAAESLVATIEWHIRCDRSLAP